MVHRRKGQEGRVGGGKADERSKRRFVKNQEGTS